MESTGKQSVTIKIRFRSWQRKIYRTLLATGVCAEIRPARATRNYTLYNIMCQYHSLAHNPFYPRKNIINKCKTMSYTYSDHGDDENHPRYATTRNNSCARISDIARVRVWILNISNTKVAAANIDKLREVIRL